MATPRLKEKYNNEVRDKLYKELELTNVNQVPRLEKIVVNMGVGRAAGDSKLLDGAIADLRVITGQQPMVTRAKKSIAGFHLREGQAIGAKVTLRGDRMWEFFDRLMSTALPRVRDFRGLNPKSFDGRGNYTMGLNEQLIFLKSGMIRSIVRAVWISRSLPRRRTTRVLKHFWMRWTSFQEECLNSKQELVIRKKDFEWLRNR